MSTGRLLTRLALLGAALGSALPQVALADAAEGLQMLNQNRTREAREEFERGAAKNEPASQAMLALFLWHGFDRSPERAKACQLAALPVVASESMGQAILARCYLAGIEVQQDLQKARSLARASALTGNNEGRFVYYLTILIDPARSYIVNGKADRERYRALAARTAEERAAEIEAIDMLAQAAQGRHLESQAALAGYLADTLGEGNRAKARSIYAQLPRLPDPIRKIHDLLAQAEAIAPQSLATIKLLHDAQTSAMIGAMAKRYPAGKGEESDCKDIRFTSASTAAPLRDAMYLPHSHPWVQRSYLVRGQWEEDWRYLVCGEQVVVRMRFMADGMSGASFSTVP
jgi:hypothetical protein